MPGGPEDFYSMDDYLGLHTGDAAQMLAHTEKDQSGGGMHALQDLSDKQEDASIVRGPNGFGDAEYANITNRVNQGMASYGDFMKGMNDPAARQALMEKTYGKGAVSAMDSAMIGQGATGAKLGQQQQDWRNFQGKMGENQYQNDQRRAGAHQMEAWQEGTDAQAKQRAAADADKRHAQLDKQASDYRSKKLLAYANQRFNYGIGTTPWTSPSQDSVMRKGFFGGGAGGNGFDSRTQDQYNSAVENNWEDTMNREETVSGKQFKVGADNEGSWH